MARGIVGIADDIAPALLPNYYVAIERHTYLNTPGENILIGIPEVLVVAETSEKGELSARSITIIYLKESLIKIRLGLLKP